MGPAPVPAGEAAHIVPSPADSHPSTYETESDFGVDSEDYHSPGETDGFGSLGEVEGDDPEGSETGSQVSDEEL